MNIFFLALCVDECASLYFNKHCIKIILEIAQMLYTAHWVADTDWARHTLSLNLEPYRKTHANHPTSRWVRQDINNYKYACNLGLALCSEYTHRYKKIHKTQARLEWLLGNAPRTFQTDPIPAFLASDNIPLHCTPIPLAMPDAYKTIDAVQSYRMYYIGDKKNIASTDAEWLSLKTQWGL